MKENRLPAILMAGPPRCGKSVLSTNISMRLRFLKIPHILFRAAPDGEGDWTYDVTTAQRKTLRHKGHFSKNHYVNTVEAIRNRFLPMLVDIGGKPQGKQFDFIQACTHVIHTYLDEQDKQTWTRWLKPYNLTTIAHLQSILNGNDLVHAGTGTITGTISGLEREQAKLGVMFDAVTDQVAIICQEFTDLQKEHLRQAPNGTHPIVIEELAEWLDVELEPEQGYWWKPEDLRPLLSALPDNPAIALYGRGPTWLYAAVAAHIAPQTLTLFDARHYGWMEAPIVQTNDTEEDKQLTVRVQTCPDYYRLHLTKRREVLTPTLLLLPTIPRDKGIVFDGKLPIWVFAALARHYADWPWLGLHEPRKSRIVEITGNVGAIRVMEAQNCEKFRNAL